MKFLNLVLFIFLVTSNSFSQELFLDLLFSDHAVIQRNKEIPVRGQGMQGRKITLVFDNKSYTTTVDQNKNWQISLPPKSEGGPYSLTVTDGFTEISRHDIVFGDVWLCSGQSNMEWPVSLCDNYDVEKTNADYNNIRHFFVSHEVSPQLISYLPSGQWKVANPQNIGEFTGVGYFFAREVHKMTGVPIGLLHSSWGGSQIESWISADAMTNSSHLQHYASIAPKSWEEADKLLEQSIKLKLFNDASREVSSEEESMYYSLDYPIHSWYSTDIIGEWDWKGIWGWRGYGYFAKDIEIGIDDPNMYSTLQFGEVYADIQVYINSIPVFKGINKGTVSIIVPPHTWKNGANRIFIQSSKAIEPSWVGLGFKGNVDDFFIKLKDKNIAISTQQWSIMPSFARAHTYAHSSNNAGNFIYNAMIHPISQFPIAGTIWYQGETNAGRAVEYQKSFPLLINSWRKLWGNDFPFYFVQLSSWGQNNNSNTGSWWAELREAQSKTLQLPNTGMAVTIDIGDPKDIHPRNKQDVGKRLAYNALENLYKRKNIPQSLMVEKAKFDNKKATITFTGVGTGFKIDDKNQYIRGFEIAGEDRKFYFAQAFIENNAIIVHHPAVKNPKSVRYAWTDTPEDANVSNSFGLPLGTFRTDDWPLLSKDISFDVWK